MTSIIGSTEGHRIRLVIGISGASGVIYGIRPLEVLASEPSVETHLVVSQSGRLTIGIETGRSMDAIEGLTDEVHAIKKHRSADLERLVQG